MTTSELLEKILEGYVLDSAGIHGVGHWQQVAANAKRLAVAEGIESDVFELFAIFHDSRRFNDGRDRQHGARGAAFARKLHGTCFQLSEEDLERLCYACEHHTHQSHHPDPVIGICWDADRLDLPRVDIVPDVRFLNSAAAKNEAHNKEVDMNGICVQP